MNPLHDLNMELLRQLAVRGKFNQVIEEINNMRLEKRNSEKIREFVTSSISSKLKNTARMGYTSCTIFISCIVSDVNDYLEDYHDITGLDKVWCKQVILDTLTNIATTCKISYKASKYLDGSISSFDFEW